MARSPRRAARPNGVVRLGSRNVEAGADPTPPEAAPRTSRRGSVLRLAGVLVAVLAIAFCVRAFADAWPDVRHRLSGADGDLVLAALGCSAVGMSVLGLLWWRCLRTFGVQVGAVAAVAWHFGGELGKYLPGGVWAVLGRGELARRGAGVPRATGYATTLIAYACMTVAALMTCGALAPIAAARGTGFDAGWALIVLIPIGLLAVHPAVLARALRVGRRLSGKRVDLETPGWPAMIPLVAWSAPAWLAIGAAATLITEALGIHQEPVRVAFAAVAAWLVGFLAVPVPAGAGVREVVFVVLCGLDAGPATAVAAIARALLIVVDGVGGLAALAYVSHAGPRA